MLGAETAELSSIPHPEPCWSVGKQERLRQHGVSTHPGVGSIRGTEFMPANRPEIPIVHVYAPRFPHEPIDIIGNKPGLERLVNVLIDAIGVTRAKGMI